MNKRIVQGIISFLLVAISFVQVSAQDAHVSAKTDATQIVVGDQVRLFIEAQHNAKDSRLQWAILPDTFNTLEIVEKGKIDTIKQGDLVTYKQRLLITGFDSGSYTIPSFVFSVIPNNGTPYTVQTDSFPLLVQTVAVDTTKGFRSIKGIIEVKASWKDYIWYIIGALVFIIFVAVVIIYFIRNKKAPAPPPVSTVIPETLQEKTLRLLQELEQKQLWQNNRVKEYYVELTDIIRVYIEERFRTHAMELTTDELLYKARTHKEMMVGYDYLSAVLYTADLAKFAKAQPTPIEHTSAMENSRQFVVVTKPVIIDNPQNQQKP